MTVLPVDIANSAENHHQKSMLDEPEQLALLDVEEEWCKHWQGMPEFVQEDASPWTSLTVHFRSRGDMVSFAETIGQAINKETKSLWFPEFGKEKFVGWKRYSHES